MDRVHVLVRYAFGGAVRREQRRLDTMKASGERPEPDAPLAIYRRAYDRVGGHRGVRLRWQRESMTTIAQELHAVRVPRRCFVGPDWAADDWPGPWIDRDRRAGCDAVDSGKRGDKVCPVGRS